MKERHWETLLTDFDRDVSGSFHQYTFCQQRALECTFSPSQSPLFCLRTTGTGWCLPIIGLSPSFQIIGQSWYRFGTVPVIGPVVPMTVWTHVVTSYSDTNGVRLWINGTLIGSTGPFMYRPSNVPNTITLGSVLYGTVSCDPGKIAKGQFYGMMDELRVYSRELNAAEVFALANP